MKTPRSENRMCPSFLKRGFRLRRNAKNRTPYNLSRFGGFGRNRRMRIVED